MMDQRILFLLQWRAMRATASTVATQRSGAEANNDSNLSRFPAETAQNSMLQYGQKFYSHGQKFYSHGQKFNSHGQKFYSHGQKSFLSGAK